MTCPHQGMSSVRRSRLLSELHAQVTRLQRVSANIFSQGRTAYHEIWLDKKLVAGEALKDLSLCMENFICLERFVS